MLPNLLSIRNQISTGNSVSFFFCDMQEHFRKHTYKGECVWEAAENLAKFSKVLNLPQYVTEHKKEVFGETISEIKAHFHEKTFLFQKTRFSMFDRDFIDKTFHPDELIVLLGVEAQICVTHTALTILESNRRLVLISDAISSRQPGERSLALKNLRDCGAYITTSEALMFLHLQDANNPNFKKLLPMFKKERRTELLNELNNL